MLSTLLNWKIVIKRQNRDLIAIYMEIKKGIADTFVVDFMNYALFTSRYGRPYLYLELFSV